MKIARGGTFFLAASLVGFAVGPGAANRSRPDNISFLHEHAADVGSAALLRFFQELPRRQSDEKPEAFAERLQEALDTFKKKLADRFTEVTLLRLLDYPGAMTRRAAVVAMGLTGTMRANAALAGMLRDEDYRVRRHAVDALWQLWFRADTAAHSRELRRLMRLAGSKEEADLVDAVAGFGQLIHQAPRFAEAYNQRAILYFRQGEFRKAIGDCEMVLKLNPYHFGAASGMGQAYMKLKDPRAALQAFRTAYRINPNMQDVGSLVRLLGEALGEGLTK